MEERFICPKCGLDHSVNELYKKIIDNHNEMSRICRNSFGLDVKDIKFKCVKCKYEVYI